MTDDNNEDKKTNYSTMSREHRIANLMADQMLDTLTNGYRTVVDGEVVRTAPTASYLNVVRQFIKDFGVKPGATPSLSSLIDQSIEANKLDLPFPNPSSKKPN